MNGQFHKNLNRMALFATIILCGVLLFSGEFLRIASANIWLNGIIIGVTLFGIGLCFVDIFKLLPEYKWMRRYFGDKKQTGDLPPRLLRPVAQILENQKPGTSVSPNTINSMLDMILNRFEDQRESVRYITNTLIFLGLLGTFWGLIHTVGGFADLIGALNFEDETVMTTLQSGLARPLAGMGTAFTSSLFGLAGSLIVGFLSLQVQLAQNAIFREIEEELTTHAHVADTADALSSIPQVNLATRELTRAVEKLEQTVSQLT
ncbi:MotA/TolQ/ExbB proton channel family protein [Lachnospiraceae bacterium OttesenSCG-928-E19]|nr:MotA/TolQ/ExbB proton channel family protein [Lachnospiraceae bacterium OttesenSCG-928-E19]